MNDIIKAFTLIGFLSTIGICIFCIFLICICIKNAAYKARVKYLYKHRFDKKPTAKCYCKDCRYHIGKDGECIRLEGDRNWSDSCFCWYAEPKEIEAERNGEEQCRMIP